MDDQEASLGQFGTHMQMQNEIDHVPKFTEEDIQEGPGKETLAGYITDTANNIADTAKVTPSAFSSSIITNKQLRAKVSKEMVEDDLDSMIN